MVCKKKVNYMVCRNNLRKSISAMIVSWTGLFRSAFSAEMNVASFSTSILNVSNFILNKHPVTISSFKFHGNIINASCDFFSSEKWQFQVLDFMKYSQNILNKHPVTVSNFKVHENIVNKHLVTVSKFNFHGNILNASCDFFWKVTVSSFKFHGNILNTSCDNSKF